MMRNGGTEFTVKISTDEVDRKLIVEKAIKAITAKISAIGLDGEVTSVEGSQDEIKVKIYGNQQLEPIRKTLFTVYQLELRKVVKGQLSYPTQESAQANVKEDQEILPLDRGVEGEPREFYIVEKHPVITGEDIRDAHANKRSGSDSDYEIMFNLRPEGAEKFGVWTETNIGNYLAIVLDKKVQSAPIIKGKITDTGVIEGRFTKASAEDIALSLNSGYLPATMTILDEEHFGN